MTASRRLICTLILIALAILRPPVAHAQKKLKPKGENGGLVGFVESGEELTICGHGIKLDVIKNKPAPQRVGRIKLPDVPRSGRILKGGCASVAYLLGESSIMVVDITDPTKPTLIHYQPLPPGSVADFATAPGAGPGPSPPAGGDPPNCPDEFLSCIAYYDGLALYHNTIDREAPAPDLEASVAALELYSTSGLSPRQIAVPGPSAMLFNNFRDLLYFNPLAPAQPLLIPGSTLTSPAYYDGIHAPPLPLTGASPHHCAVGGTYPFCHIRIKALNPNGLSGRNARSAMVIDLRRVMSERDLTTTEVACQMKITPGTVRDWLEKGAIPYEGMAEAIRLFINALRGK